MKRALFALVISVLLAAPAAYGQYGTSNYMEAGGASWVVGGTLTIASGGTLNLASGSTFTLNLAQLTGQNSDALTLGVTNNTLIWQVDSTNTAIITGADASGAANTTYDTAGAGSIDLGSADVTDIQVVTDGGTLDVGTTANTLTFTALTTNAAVFTGADAASPADTVYDTTGAGAITVGSADVTSITLTTDGSGTGEVVLPLQSVAGAEMVNDTVDGAQLADTITLDAALAIAGGEGYDVTLSPPSSNGNAGARNQFVGLPRIKNVGIGTMVNGTTNTVLTDIGDSDTPATDWTAIDADAVMSNDATYYRVGAASLKMAVAITADATDGCTNTLASGDQDWTDDEAVGMWVYSDASLSAGDLTLVITDSGAGDTSVDIPAITADNWQWVEVDVSGVANASKDVITDLSIELSAAGAVVAASGAFNVYFDFIVKWDVADEDSLGAAILADGVLSLTVIDATDSGASSVNLAEGTDYFVHYQSGNDALVMITDQSGADKVGIALIAY